MFKDRIKVLVTQSKGKSLPLVLLPSSCILMATSTQLEFKLVRLLTPSIPAIAQLAEHLTVDTCRNQMVPGSIPGGRIFGHGLSA